MSKSIVGLLLIITSALFDSYAAFIVKAQFNRLGAIDYSSFKSLINYISTFLKSPLLLSAIVTFVCAPGLWFLALNKVDLSIGYPVLVGFHLLFILVFGIFFLNEALTTKKMIGSLLILISLYFFYQE